MRLDEILQWEYPLRVRPDRCTDGTFCYVAEHPDLPGCEAHGDTISEAKELLGAARVAYLRHLFARGYAIPAPSPAPAEWQSGVVSRETPGWTYTVEDKSKAGSF
jgi:predicted RNase H-like HicB family nuclease